MMFQRGPGSRTLAAAAVAASCLAAAACGAAGSGGGAASPSSTVDPLAGLSASTVNAKAIADGEAATTLTMKGTVAESGKTYTIDMAMKHNQGCKGSIGISGTGSVTIIVIGSTVYFEADSQFWKSVAGTTADASAAVALLDGKYLKVPETDQNVSGLTDMCSLSQMLNSSSDKTTPTYTKEPVTTLNGTRVLPLKVSDGSTEYVTDTSKPEFVQASAPKGTSGGAGKITIGVGVPVTLTPPPASDIVDGSALGL